MTTKYQKQSKLQGSKIKKPLAFLVCFFIVGFGFGQNLVGNGSFEDTVSCPTSRNISFVQNWMSFGGSPDYYNACANPGFVSVPSNLYGLQNAADGNAYCGIITYVKDDNSNYSWYREVLGAQLISPLSIGQKYFVSFKANFTLNDFETDCAANKLGAWFTNTLFDAIDSLTSAPLANFAHVYSDSIITDTIGWTTISGSFVADDAYQYLAIGNFFKNNVVDTLDYSNGLFASYYYIDDVRVSTDSAFVASNLELIKKTITCSIYPNPSNGTIKVELPNNFKKANLSIYDILGQSVYKNIISTKENLELDFLNNGVYTIILNVDSILYSSKLIIQK